MAVTEGGPTPLILPVLQGVLSGGATLGRRAGGRGPFRPWLKTPPADGAYQYPDAWSLPQMVRPVMFLIEAGLKKGMIFRGMRLPLPVLPTASLTIAGVSRDGNGVALGGCTCTLFRVTQAAGVTVFTQIAQQVSDSNGNYAFVVDTETPYRVTFDLDGVPVRAGITLKSLTGS